MTPSPHWQAGLSKRVFYKVTEAATLAENLPHPEVPSGQSNPYTLSTHSTAPMCHQGSGRVPQGTSAGSHLDLSSHSGNLAPKSLGKALPKTHGEGSHISHGRMPHYLGAINEKALGLCAH